MILLLSLVSTHCAPSPTPTATPTLTPTLTPSLPPSNTPTVTPTEPVGFDKWSLWSGETQLRGANIFQRRVYPELDYDWLGPNPLGPPFTQEDFNQLASLGCNYVNISHPGL